MQLKFETGRSMVEIIGVLAVAGVLSIDAYDATNPIME